MHRFIARIVFALVFLFSSTASIAFAQTADAVIEKHLAALGGRAALAKLTSRRSTGTVSVSSPAGEASGSFESNLKAPNKSRIYMRLDPYLVLRTVTKVNSEAGDIEQISTVSDYRVVHRVKVPFQIVNRTPLQTITVKIAKVEHNVALDDAVFAKK